MTIYDLEILNSRFFSCTTRCRRISGGSAATHHTYAYVSITRIEFVKLKENLQFLDNTLKTVLTEYWDYFQNGLLRACLSASALWTPTQPWQRGLPAKEVFAALIQLLNEWDEADGKCPLRKPTQN